MITYFVIQTFSRGKGGKLVADEPMPVQSATQAERMALRLSETKAGVVAFSRTGDVTTGEFDDAIILASYGQIPAELSEAA